MKKRKAVFTIVKNEKVILPLWLKYYSKFFQPEDIYVLDHQSTDGSTDGLACNIKIVHSDFAFDHVWLNRVVCDFQIELLREYTTVLFVEADEFVFHKDGLDTYIDNLKIASSRCVGFELQHVTDKELPLNLGRPVLEQRSFWYQNPEYCKTLISKVPIHWNLGFHECDNHGRLDSDLYLVHLHRFDFDIANQKNMARAMMKWNKFDLDNGLGFQNRIVGEQFRQWFERYRAWNVIEPINEDLKASLAF